MCFELNRTIKASNANLHIFKQIGAPPISQNSWGAKSASVSIKDTRDAYGKNIHFISKKGNLVLLGLTGQTGPTDWSDRFVLTDTKYNNSSIQNASH